MHRLQALHREWNRNPPVALMIKSYLGITGDVENKLPPAAVPQFETLPDIEE